MFKIDFFHKLHQGLEWFFHELDRVSAGDLAGDLLYALQFDFIYARYRFGPSLIYDMNRTYH